MSGGRGWLRLAVLTMGAGLVLALAPLAPAGASGGGGCGKPVSDANGTRVRIKQFCFVPTVLHVRRGGTVSFTNLDPFGHNVQGASVAWGSWKMLRTGRPVVYRFVKGGVYPYVCSMHLGMVGAIVVGNGNGRGGAGITTTQAGPVVRVKPERARLVRSSVGPDSLGPWPATTIVGFGLFTVALIALLRGRRRAGG
jgi:plastocyanin